MEIAIAINIRKYERKYAIESQVVSFVHSKSKKKENNAQNYCPRVKIESMS